jgi:hypothetical protein
MTGVMGLDDGPASELAAAKYLPQKAQCPACERRDQAEKLALKSVTEALAKADADMTSALQQSDGFCLLHLRLALEAARNPQAFELLVDLTQQQLVALIRDLDEFIRKSDHRFRHETISDAERASWRVALQRVAGLKTEL